MPSGPFARVKGILVAARDLQGADRERYLDEACGGDAGLRSEIDALLRFEDETPSVLATGGLAREVDKAGAPPLDLGRPTEIGPYLLVDVLGEGGMGVVYRAEQTEPIRREVALKVVRRGLDTDSIIARFGAERQALALMDHPNIAKVLDAGATPDGRPYFAMELVHGRPLTRFCDEHRLSTEERLRLFVRVCRAVQHAHQRGIIHRDLKPSNVLVAEADGQPVPKVIDFGIAKVVAPDADAPLLTVVGHFVGTPEYTSPEQAGVRPGGVDTRADVYSLGVMLYELLTGCRPYEFDTYTPVEIERVLRDAEPAKPSTAFTRSVSGPHAVSATPFERLSARRSTVARLRRQLAGDLDNIVLKALAKDPNERYGSVEQLTDDIERYLAGQPVSARPATWRYRVRKFVGRHRLGTGLGAALVITIVGAGVALAVQSARIANERDRALAAEQRALTEAATAQQTADFLASLFQVSNPIEGLGADVSAREVLDRGAERIQSSLSEQPEVRARLLNVLGSVYVSLGLNRAAIPLVEQAVEIRRRLDAPDAPSLALVIDSLAEAYQGDGNFEAAEPLYREALAINRRAFPEGSAQLATTISNLAVLCLYTNKLDEAEGLMRESLAMRERLLGPDHADTTFSANNLGVLLQRKGEYDEAETLYRRTLAARLKIYGPEHPEVANITSNLAALLLVKGDYAAAEPLFRRALELYRKLLPPDHVNLARPLLGLGELALRTGKPAEAEPLIREGLRIRLTSMPATHFRVASAERLLGECLTAEGRHADAEAALLESYRHLRDALGDSHAETRKARQALAELYRAWGKPAAAARYDSGR